LFNDSTEACGASLDVSAGFLLWLGEGSLRFTVYGVIDWFENKMDFNSVILQNFSKFAV